MLFINKEINKEKKTLFGRHGRVKGKQGSPASAAAVEESGENSFTAAVELEKKRLNDKLIDDLVKSVDAAGRDLSKAPSLQQFTRYKRSVKKLLEHLVPNAFSIETLKGKPFVKNGSVMHKENQILKVIDTELESILRYVHGKEQGHLKIAASVTKIKGMIYDALT